MKQKQKKIPFNSIWKKIMLNKFSPIEGVCNILT